ncbi:1-acyl-sn-glycerol-3-phosphate acyltransferase [Pengzhenrongella sp.]|uniref:1-acyl-sn-glycerol-3-phosphate acyltransferase n=1 Tax=Pengzhenrongella sp. TaxID=2888820 RepID=UPI002F938339
MIRRGVARLYWAASRWTYRSEPMPAEGVGILIGAPHTSNWDFILMLAITWRSGVSARFLGKQELFRGVGGPLMRALGGIPVDRRDATRIVRDVVAHVNAGERFFLVVTPEGTRSKATYWKSGFYRIAVEAKLPITLGYVDRTTMTTGLGPTFRLTGDVHADMDRIRAFYADKSGFLPANRSEPRMREEDTRPRVEGSPPN